MSEVPALEVGGSHVSAGRVDAQTWTVRADIARFELDAHASADDVVTVLATAATAVGPLVDGQLCVAIPGPFDYGGGVAWFHGVGKFDALNGVDVRAALLGRLSDPPAQIGFVNDAAAFTAGEWVSGSARGMRRVVGLTLGTGVGSSFLAEGVVCDDGPTVPPHGRVDLLTIDGEPLEDRVSTRAIVSAAAAGRADVGVREIAARARAGDNACRLALHRALFALGRAMAPWLGRFQADMMVVGGGVAQAWDFVHPALTAGLARERCQVPARPAAHSETAGLVGAAWLLTRGSP